MDTFRSIVKTAQGETHISTATMADSQFKKAPIRSAVQVSSLKDH